MVHFRFQSNIDIKTFNLQNITETIISQRTYFIRYGNFTTCKLIHFICQHLYLYKIVNGIIPWTKTF